MAGIQISVVLTIPEDVLKSALVSAVESSYGIRGWATPGEVTKGKSDDYTEVDVDYDLEDGPDGNRQGNTKLGVKEMAEGIRRILSGEVKEVGAEFRGRLSAAIVNDAGGDIDAPLADAIAQAAILGKVVYG